jgi:parvulin-like peptidyl-prolyl isomerase
MPLLTRIRESMTTIFAIFAGVFVVYIVLDWGMDISGTQSASRSADAQMIGYIDGEGITFREFSDIVQQNVDNQRAQGGPEPEEYQVRLIRDQVWNSLVTERLYDREIGRLGLSVSDQEVIDVVRGDNPPSFLRTQFTDSTGTFNRQAYDAALSDPRNKQIMVNLERVIRQQRLREKLQSVVLAGVTVSEGEVARKFADDNVSYSTEFLSFDPNALVPDSAVPVGADDLRSYYDAHITDYKVEATRTLKYVTFRLAASPGDTEYVKREIEDILRRVKDGADFGEIAAASSAVPETDVFFRHGELDPGREEAVFAAKAGDVVGPLLERDGYHLVKVLEFRKGEEDFIHAQHVLIRVEGGDSAAAERKAREVLAKARAGEDFGGLAAAYSGEPGADVRKGDLGWFGKGRMVKPFENAVYAAKPGQIIGPVRTDFGYHVIKLIARDSREVKLRDIHMPIEMSPKTSGDIYQKAQDFAYFAKENGLEKEAEINKLTVTETPPFTRKGNITGIGNFPAVNRFAFEGNVGDVSDAHSIDRGYIVAMISGEKEAGVKPLDEVKAGIEVLVRREKKSERAAGIAAELVRSVGPGDSLGTVASGRNGVRAERIDDLRISSTVSRTTRDPAFVGALEALSPGQVSRPVAGARGVYVVRLLGKTAFDSTAYRAQRAAIFTQILEQKRNLYFNEWTEKLKESAEIEDKRDMFYR